MWFLKKKIRKITSINQLTVVETELLCLELRIDMNTPYNWRLERYDERIENEFHLVKAHHIYRELAKYADFIPYHV